MDRSARLVHRRHFLQMAALGLGAAGWRGLVSAYTAPAGGPAAPLWVTERGVDLVIARTPIAIGGRVGRAVTINGTVPGPLLRMREGENVTVRVTNRLEDDHTSIHWHGFIIPSEMDGVPGISFPGIKPGETFTYRFPVRQNGTYWYHSHSGFQEQLGHYGPIIIEPAGADPVSYDREHVVQLSDWTFENPRRVLSKMKKQGGVFNFQQRTVGDFFRDARQNGLRATIDERMQWGRMRMNPTDIQDITGSTYTYLMNGLPPQENWMALFSPGQRVRLRFINSAAQTMFNVRIPGLAMTVVQADGQDVHPVTVDEFQISVAETYDVIVTPKEDRAYTIFAEAMDRSGYTRGTLAPRPGMSAPVPALRERPVRTMIDMGMDMPGHETSGMAGMDHGAMQHGATPKPSATAGHDMGSMPGMGHGAMSSGAQPTPGMPGHEMGGMPGMAQAGPVVARHGPDTHGPGNTTVAMVQRSRLGEPPTGLDNVEHRVLVYTDLKALQPNKDFGPAGREIEIHLTGNMEAFIWGINGKRFSEVREPIQLQYGERVRITLVNDTMMEHPMHMHGMFKQIVNGAGPQMPRKHTISVRPAERLSYEFTADEPGNWAFHCHLLYHMEAGMFTFFNVPEPSGRGRS